MIPEDWYKYYLICIKCKRQYGTDSNPKYDNKLCPICETELEGKEARFKEIFEQKEYKEDVQKIQKKAVRQWKAQQEDK